MAGNSELMMEKVLSQSWVHTTPETDANPPVPDSLVQEANPNAIKQRLNENKIGFMLFKNTKIRG
jgi:hypothetical protein